MTIETLTCDKCGAKLVIETDDDHYREKKKKDFNRKHDACDKRQGCPVWE